MEVADSQKEPLLEASTAAGGFKALPSIIVNESLEKVSTYGLSSDMTPYLTRAYGVSGPAASYVLSFWNVAVNFIPVVAALLADSCTGRYTMIGFGTITCFLGTVVLWSTAAIREARPFCNQLSGSCESSTAFQLLLLYSSLALIAVGVGGIRSSSMAFGADQLTNDYTVLGLIQLSRAIFHGTRFRSVSRYCSERRWWFMWKTTWDGRWVLEFLLF